MPGFLIYQSNPLQFQNTHGLQQDQQQNGGDILDHHHIQPLPAKLFPVAGHFIDDDAGFQHPADKYTGGNGHHGQPHKLKFELRQRSLIGLFPARIGKSPGRKFPAGAVCRVI